MPFALVESPPEEPVSAKCEAMPLLASPVIVAEQNRFQGDSKLHQLFVRRGGTFGPAPSSDREIEVGEGFQMPMRVEALPHIVVCYKRGGRGWVPPCARRKTQGSGRTLRCRRSRPTA